MNGIANLLTIKKRLQNASRNSDGEKGAITVAETLIALGVGATVLAVVFAGIPAVVDARNTSAAVSGITQIASAVRTTFGVRNSYTGLTTELARNLAGFPPHFISGSNIQHPWGGDVEVENGTDTGTFTISFDDMPTGPCSSLATTTLDLANSVQIGGKSVNLSATDDPSTNDRDESEAADIAGLCSATGTSEMIWTFRG